MEMGKLGLEFSSLSCAGQSVRLIHELDILEANLGLSFKVSHIAMQMVT